ncbi:MAG: hypothetical protein VX498_03225, partial [Myxococcota bacterium]|nr:hypothetical protein [Myxococcota bacterium]
MFRVPSQAVLLLSFLLVPGPVLQAQEEEPEGSSNPSSESGIEVTTASEPIPSDPFAVDRGPLDHLGWGTLEDLYVDLGAGAAVNLFSGNLVISIQPFPRADVLPDSQLGLTYNHL